MKKILFLLFLPLYLFSFTTQESSVVLGCSQPTTDPNFLSCIYIANFLPSNYTKSTVGACQTPSWHNTYVILDFYSNTLFSVTYLRTLPSLSSCGYSTGLVYYTFDVGSFDPNTVYCSDNQHFDPNTFKCVDNCPPNSTYVNSDQGCVCNAGYVLKDGQCVNPCVGFTPPSTYKNYDYITTFTDSSYALSFIKEENVLNGFAVTGTTLGAPDGCNYYYLYGDYNTSTSKNCENVDPPLTDEFGNPYQATFSSYSGCINYIKKFALNASGTCKNFDNCTLTFGYYKTNDDNNLSMPKTDLNNTIDDKPNNDNNYTSPNTLDTNNTDNVDMSPVLKSLSDMSLANHNDLKNLADKQDISNNLLSSANSKLNNINNKLDISNNFLNDINNNVKSANDVLNNLLTGDIFDSLSLDNIANFFNNVSSDVSKIKSSFDDTMSIIQNGFDTPAISSGETPVFTAVVFGKTVTLDLCPAFSYFRPFLYFIFYGIFLFISIKIFWIGMKIGV